MHNRPNLAKLIWINNGKENRRVLPDEVPEGWVLGRLPLGVSASLRKHINNASSRAGKLKRYGYTDDDVAIQRAQGNKWCSWHKTFHPAVEFGSRTSHQLICKKAWNERGQSKRFGVPRTWYAVQLAKQDGHCALCPNKEDNITKGRRLHIDHDHACCPALKSCGKCVRGLLCGGCNHRIGRLEEIIRESVSFPEAVDGTWLARALTYLRKYATIAKLSGEYHER